MRYRTERRLGALITVEEFEAWTVGGVLNLMRVVAREKEGVTPKVKIEPTWEKTADNMEGFR